MIKRLIVLAVAICIALALTIVLVFMSRPDPIKDLQENAFTVYNEATLQDIMESICEDITWKVVEQDHSAGFYRINVEGAMKDIPIPFLDGYSGAPIGFDVDVYYNKENVIYQADVVRVYFEDKDMDVDYDVDWAMSLIYSAHKYITEGTYQYYPANNMK